MSETISVDTLLNRFEQQKVLPRHYAVKCPRCGLVQSPESFIRSGAFQGMADAEPQLGFTCVGTFLKAPPEGTGPGCFCTFSRPGYPEPPLLVKDGKHIQPCFALATREEAQALMKSWK